MKYEVAVDIDQPRDRVIELFTDSSKYKDWQPSLVQCDLLEGDPGTAGAKTKVVHKMGRKEVEMLETIQRQDLPDAQTLTYEANKVWNQVVNRFDAIDDSRTRVTIESEFQCKGVMRILSRLFPGAFKKETLKHLRRFKKFAESQASG